MEERTEVAKKVVENKAPGLSNILGKARGVAVEMGPNMFISYRASA